MTKQDYIDAIYKLKPVNYYQSIHVDLNKFSENELAIHLSKLEAKATGIKTKVAPISKKPTVKNTELLGFQALTNFL